VNTAFKEQVYQHLESERSLEHFLGFLKPSQQLEMGRALSELLPQADAVLTLLGGGQGLGFAVALERKVPLIVAQDRPFKFDGVYASEVDDKILFALQDQLEGVKSLVVIQDTLRRGYSSLGLVGLAAQAGARVVGFGALVEYSNLGGRNRLEMMSFPVQVLAQVAHTPRGLQPERRGVY
jgi:adenine/guanine phosphoribosyltransferase-like PRPP-binding protein